jgi:hypothetical protein
VPIAKRATRRPGQILYRDAWQIVAKPEQATPDPVVLRHPGSAEPIVSNQEEAVMPRKTHTHDQPCFRGLIEAA